MNCENTITDVITLDGTVGVGKSTVARRLAKRLGWRHVDTGAMYRAVTLAAMRETADFSNQEVLGKLAEQSRIELLFENDNYRVFLNGEDVSEAIRDPEVSRNTSSVADAIPVRKKLVALQRDMGLKGPSILEGRDIGTVVFPDAFWKFYLDASLQERTRRRVLQLKGKGRDLPFDKAMEAIRVRDMRDRSRPWGPLRIASGSIVIDTTFMGEDEVIDLIYHFVNVTIHGGKLINSSGGN